MIGGKNNKQRCFKRLLKARVVKTHRLLSGSSYFHMIDQQSTDLSLASTKFLRQFRAI